MVLCLWCLACGGGDLQFVSEDERGRFHQVDLHQAATGATSLAIIGLLLQQNVLIPNSVLIFDEPEANLHPAWQYIMIQILYQLSLAGITVIIASHSFDMIEGIEKMMDNHQRQGGTVADHFSVIQLENGKTIDPDKLIYKKLSAVKADLGMPLVDLFCQSNADSDSDMDSDADD